MRRGVGIAAFAGFLLISFSSLRLVYALPSPEVEQALSRALLLALLMGATWMGRASVENLRYLTFTGAMGALFYAAWQVPALSPSPYIDVFSSNTAAAEHLLAGRNPYSQVYKDIYRGFYDYGAGFLYFPGLLWVIAPVKALFGDIRYAGILGHFMGAAALVAVSKRRLKRPEAGWMAALLWAALPVQYFVFEQAWTDSILVGAIGVVLWVWAVRPNLRPGVLEGVLAFVFALKQHAFLPAIYVLQDLGSRDGVRKWGLRVALTGGISILFLLPFLLWDWDGFYRMTIASQLGASPRLDSLNWTSWLLANRAGSWGAIPQAAMSVLGIFLGAWVLFMGRAGRVRDPGRMAAALWLGYGFSFLFGKWAFCNYHYLLLYFLVWMIPNWEENAMRLMRVYLGVDENRTKVTHR
jgi:hypothetical protein